MPTSIERYRRTYHNSEETTESLRGLPGWMELHNPTSVGYGVTNALFGVQVEHPATESVEIRDNTHPDLGNYNEPWKIWRTLHDTSSGNIPPSAYVTAGLESDYTHGIPSGTIIVNTSNPETINLINVTSEEALMKAPPTRLRHRSADDVTPTPLRGDITGLSYVRNWSKVDSSGVTLIPEQNVYIVNTNARTPVSTTNSTTVFDTSWTYLDSYDYGLGTVNYATKGKYEVITDPSGYRTSHVPVASTVLVYDYINLDTNGHAQLINSDNWQLSQYTSGYITYSIMAMSGVNQYNTRPIGNSNYFMDYEYWNFNYPKQLTTQSALWNHQEYGGPPIFTAEPTNYNKSIVPHSLAVTPSGNSMALRVDPRDIRPGSTADIKYSYVMASDVLWTNAAAFDHDLSADTAFLDSASGGARVYYAGNNITDRFRPNISGSSRIYIPRNTEVTHSPPFTVRMYYNAEKTYSNVTAVQSFTSKKSEVDLYPRDYMVEGGYLVPYSILPLSDSNDWIQLSLLAATGDQFEVVTNLIFNGIAYDKDKDCYWMLESNNLVLYKVRPIDGSIIDKWNIFRTPNFYFGDYTSRASGVIDQLQDRDIGYPILDQGRDRVERLASGIVYYNDYLYISSSASGLADEIGAHGQGVVPPGGTGIIGGTGIYRLDTYNDRVMDMEWDTTPKEVHPHYPYPHGITSVVDITLDDDDNFLVASETQVHKLELMYDYALVDSSVDVTRGTVFYRESYPSGTTVANFVDWRE